MLPKPSGISVMPWMCMLPYGITGDGMRFRKENRIPTRWKATMPNSDIISLAWRARLVVFRVVRMLCIAPFDCLSITSTNVNCENTSSRNIPFTSPTSFTHLFSHSPFSRIFHGGILLLKLADLASRRPGTFLPSTTLRASF